MLEFFEDVEQVGKDVDAADGKTGNPVAVGAVRGSERFSVAAEASLLKGMFAKLRQMY
jgi:hypothetical protein